MPLTPPTPFLRRQTFFVSTQEFSHAAAYGAASPLGKPLMAARTLPHVDVGACQDFVASQYQPSRMVLAAAGMDHTELVEIAKASPFGQLAAGTAQTLVKADYIGGEYREQADEMLTHFALTFKGVGWNDKVTPCPFCSEAQIAIRGAFIGRASTKKHPTG